MSDAIRQLAELHGIAAAYQDYLGRECMVAVESQAAILEALAVPAQSEGDIARSLETVKARQWQALTVPVLVVEQGESARVPLSLVAERAARSVRWRVTPESGEALTGEVRLASLPLVEHASIDGQDHERRVLELPMLPDGYHQLQLSLDDGRDASVRVVVSPGTCHQSPAITAGRRLWGIAVQLYTLRSPDNWGIGDFRDLRRLVEWAAPLGCDLIGLNPLHALMPAHPAHISPYSPSHRQFLNPLYIAVDEVADLVDCAQARQLLAMTDVQEGLLALRAVDTVDYLNVASMKLPTLMILFQSFQTHHLQTNSSRAQAFQQFVQMRGEALRLHAIHDALDAHLLARHPQQWGWPSWPQEYQHPGNAAVTEFARDHADEVQFHMYLQWLAAEQLGQVQQVAREAGMEIGLYGDVAVGANPAGSETWSNQSLYVMHASVGAPPDALAPKGQDWGIPPQSPAQLQAQGFEPFLGLVRDNMRHVAALRFDHVMTLYRLWWVPQGKLSRDGTYVHYPLPSLMRLLALESQRQHCVVIGEDLGTVPPAVTTAMEHSGAYHYKVLLFEQSSLGRFKPPQDYISGALAVVSTHDLPTLRGWWESRDIELREQLDLYPTEAMREQAITIRAAERLGLMQALVDAGLWHWLAQQPLPEYSTALARAVHAYVGLSSADMALVQIEDLLGMREPVNVPGTNREYPNWQRKLTRDLPDIFNDPAVLDILEGLRIARNGINPNG